MENEFSIEQIKEMLINFGKTYTTTENGAITPISSGSKLIDQFGKVASLRNRSYEDVCKDMCEIWDENPTLALKFIFYLRMITRVTELPNANKTEKVQKGQGCRDEAFKRLIWLFDNHRDIFYRNIYILPIIGSWKDLWTLMVMMYDKGVGVNRQVFYSLMATAMGVDSQIDLIKKFMPRIKTKSNLKSSRSMVLDGLAREFAEFLGMTPRQYNKFKSNGKAHEFQRIICSRKFNEINWNKIPGIALGNLTKGDFITRHELVDSFLNWIEKQETVKFNGYPYDLLKRIKGQYSIFHRIGQGIEIPYALETVTNLQFENLISTAERDGKITENVLCALDTSGSMDCGYGDIKPIDICLSLGIYFSTLNKGHFHKQVVMFDNRSRMHKLNGSFCDMLRQIPLGAMGGTNFMSVIGLLVQYRRENPNIPLEEYPTTLLVVSDMQFDPVRGNTETNYERSKKLLLQVFPSEFVDKIKFIWWNVNGSHGNMPATMEDGGCYFFSGFDGAIVSLLLGNEPKDATEKQKKTMVEILNEALNQEVLTYIH